MEIKFKNFIKSPCDIAGMLAIKENYYNYELSFQVKNIIFKKFLNYYYILFFQVQSKFYAVICRFVFRWSKWSINKTFFINLLNSISK